MLNSSGKYLLLILLFIAELGSAQNELPSWEGICTVFIDTTFTIDEKVKSRARVEIWPSIVDSSSADYSGFCGIELHGNSTLMAPKKSYELELRLENNEEMIASILGFAPGSDFVLLANYYDYSFLRNTLAFKTWEHLGHYVPEYRYCRVFINGIDQGLFMLVEQIKAQEGRLELGTTDINSKCPNPTAPFLVKMDWEAKDLYTTARSLTKSSIDYQLVYPKRKNLHYTAVSQIEKYLSEVENSLKAITKSTPEESILPYDSLIDVNSYADFFILNELSKNPDGYKTSTYFYRQAANEEHSRPKLTMGPIWDFDLAFANVQYEHYDEVEGWAFQQMGPMSHVNLMPSWWHSLTCDEQFRNCCKERLQYLRTQFSAEACENYLEGCAFLLEEAVQQDVLLWQDAHAREYRAVGPLQLTFAEDVTRIVKFYRARIEWMLNNLDAISCMPPDVVYMEHKVSRTFVFQNSDAPIKIPLYSEDEQRAYKNTVGGERTVQYKLVDGSGELIKDGILDEPMPDYSFEISELGAGVYYLLINEIGLARSQAGPWYSSGTTPPAIARRLSIMNKIGRASCRERG